jgi:hypothetical protein
VKEPIRKTGIPAGLTAALLLLVTVAVGAQQPQQPLQAQAGEKVVTAEGMGAIIAGDKAKAEEDAVNDALRNAVEQVVGMHVESQTLVDNFVVVQDRILSRTRGFVSGYRVVSREEEPDLIRVKVEATVKESDLVSDLEAIGLLIARKNYPRLLVLIDEQIFLDEGGEKREPTTVDASTATGAILTALRPKGFRFVDPTVVAAGTEANLLSSALQGNAAEAVRIGRAYQADVILLGRAISRRGTIPYGGAGAGLVSMQAVVNVQAIRADTGEIFARSDDTAPQAGNSPLETAHLAIRKAVDRLLPRLEEQVLDNWSQEVTSGTVVELVIVNDLGFTGVRRFISLLPGYVRGAEEVSMRNFAEGMTTLEVRFKGSALDLAGELSSKEWAEFKIDVTGVTANRVQIRVTPKEKP